MGQVAAEPQNSREAEAPARERVSVEKCAEGATACFCYKKKICRGNGQNEKERCVLTIDKFCEDAENFDNLSVGA